MRSRPFLPGNPGHHAVQFYTDKTRLCLSIADFLGDGLAAGQPTLLIATPEHCARIVLELTSRRFDIPSLLRSGGLLTLDAKETLDKFMVDGETDAHSFREVIGGAIERAAGSGDESVVRAYGEMVDVLWRDGNQGAAIQVEILWNDLARRHAFSLMCGYSMDGFERVGHDEVCAHHTHVHGAIIN